MNEASELRRVVERLLHMADDKTVVSTLEEQGILLRAAAGFAVGAALEGCAEQLAALNGNFRYAIDLAQAAGKREEAA